MRQHINRAATILLAVFVVAAFIVSYPAVGAEEAFTAIPSSFSPTSDADTGAFTSPNMTIDVVLSPSNPADLSQLLSDLYNSQSARYQQWLAQGEFYTRYEPSAEQTAAVTEYLQSSGLVIQPSPSPFLVRASGPSGAVEAALQTTVHNYRDTKGISYYSNSSAIALPSRFAAGVLGVVGLSNTVRLQPHVRHGMNKNHPGGGSSCETGYVTAAELFAYVNDGTGFPYGYGGGPGCSGLTPTQTNSIYNAPSGGPRTQGAGINFAVFELAVYQSSDIAAWTVQFYGPHYQAPLVNVYTDGGSINPICPAGDECPLPPYSGDIEVDADIEMMLALAPAARHVLVYDAPNDYTGQTELDQYTAIAKANLADVVSSSWGLCENDAGAGYAEAENEIFEQMAAQGQSMFGDAGDTGAFDCIRDGTGNMVNVSDPGTQPWVTSTGGTSLGQFNPGENPYPGYPRPGTETVWNVDDLCNLSNNEGGQTGIFWCTNTGAGGGGNSQFWGRPFYQRGPGVNNGFNTRGDGNLRCALAPPGTPCRQVPDVSANADEYTPYAEYCTATASTPGSNCGFSADELVAGWFGIGGTSLSTPLWAALIGDRDGFFGHRTGNANPLLYQLFDTGYGFYFHDITGFGQSTNNNGLFPVTPGYDMATGLGTPNMSAIIVGSF